jgi:hypothetical protein
MRYLRLVRFREPFSSPRSWRALAATASRSSRHTSATASSSSLRSLLVMRESTADGRASSRHRPAGSGSRRRRLLGRRAASSPRGRAGLLASSSNAFSASSKLVCGRMSLCRKLSISVTSQCHCSVSGNEFESPCSWTWRRRSAVRASGSTHWVKVSRWTTATSLHGQSFVI